MASPLLADIVALVASAWPEIATTAQVTVGNTTSTLDPLMLGTTIGASGGPCPWACGTVVLTAVRGLSTMAADATAATLTMQNCSPPAVLLTVPVTIPQLQADVTANGKALGIPLGGTPTLVLNNVTGTLTATLPVTAGADANTFALQIAQISANLYLDLQTLATVDNAVSVATPFLNDVLHAGVAPVMAGLASNEFTQLINNFLQGQVANVSPLTVPSWVLPGMGGTPPPPQPCTQKGQTFQLPCDPCDTCCLCATQSRCADATCMAQCGACMPVQCGAVVPWSLVAVAILFSLLFLGVLAALGYGIYKLVALAVHRHRGSKVTSGYH